MPIAFYRLDVALSPLAAVKQKVNPSPEEVREVQAAVLAAVTSLFDQHKHLMPGWEGKCLEIV